MSTRRSRLSSSALRPLDSSVRKLAHPPVDLGGPPRWVQRLDLGRQRHRCGAQVLEAFRVGHAGVRFFRRSIDSPPVSAKLIAYGPWNQRR